jgi:hypothetical protein
MEKLITVSGKRWFDKTYGNTYHSVDVTVEDFKTKIVESFYAPLTYGYDDQYRETASKLLEKHTDILKGIEDAKYGLNYWKVLESLQAKGIVVKFFVQDVTRKRDL